MNETNKIERELLYFEKKIEFGAVTIYMDGTYIDCHITVSRNDLTNYLTTYETRIPETLYHFNSSRIIYRKDSPVEVGLSGYLKSKELQNFLLLMIEVYERKELPKPVFGDLDEILERQERERENQTNDPYQII